MAVTILDDAEKFLEALGFTSSHQGRDLIATKEAYGTTLTYVLRHEDRLSFSQMPDVHSYFADIKRLVSDDPKVIRWVLVTKDVDAGSRYLDFAKAASVRGVRTGTLADFLDTFVPRARISSRLKANRDRVSYVNRSVRVGLEEFADGVRHLIDSWVLKSGGQKLLVLHGPAGYGKSLLAERLVEHLSALGEKDADLPNPFLVRFADHADVRGIDSLLDRAINWYGLNELSPEALKFLIKKGRVIWVLDGFDELSEEAGAKLSLENIQKLADLIRTDSEGKIILTARSTFLETGEYSLTSAGGFSAAELCPLGETQFKEFLDKNPPDGIGPADQERHRERCMQFIRDNSELQELCSSPLLLRWVSDIVASNPKKLPKRRIEVYEAFSTRMFGRERVRQKYDLTDSVQSRFLARMADLMLDEGVYQCPSTLVDDCAHETLDALPELKGDDARKAELVGKLRIHGMMTAPLGKSEGHLWFVHESLRDFFAAEYLKSLIQAWPEDRNITSSFIASRNLPVEVASFLSESLSADEEAKLAKIVSREPRGILARNCFVLSVQSREGEQLKRIFPTLELTGMNLRSLAIKGIQLDKFSFPDADLSDASFDSCNLDGADFRGAQLQGLKLNDCDLAKANFDYPAGIKITVDDQLLEDADTIARALVQRGALVRTFTDAPVETKTTPEDLLRFVIGKFYKGEDRKSTRLVDRQAESVSRGKAGNERTFIADHVVPALIRHGMLVKKRVAHGEILGVDPRRNSELIDYRYERKISSGIRKILDGLPGL